MVGRRRELVAWALVLSAAGALARCYYFDVMLPNESAAVELQRAILGGGAPSPYRYRILAPLIIETLARLFDLFQPTREAYRAAFACFSFGALSLVLGGLYKYLRRWFETPWALVGILLAAATMPLALRDHYYQPWSFLEPGILALAMLAVVERRRCWVVVLTAVAALNRETALLIPALCLFLGWEGTETGEKWSHERRRAWWTFVASVLACAAVQLAVRVLVGPSAHVRTVEQILGRNVNDRYVLVAVWNVLLFFGFMWFAAARGLRDAPGAMRRAAVVAPLYLVLIAVWGVWREVRLLMSLYPIVLPLGLWYVRDRMTKQA
jgi:hypothetical protein